jgi:hypothetical protein
MIVLRLLFSIGAAALFAAVAVQAWRTGSVPTKGAVISRRHNPILFWLTVALNLVFAAGFFAGIFVLKR